ncbi:MAG: Holliday junction branch migration protein RuvA [Planctomycetota bacterium]|nr:Holliday junction branch migration protein RuvA [Planctomycetota bacterium]
MIITLKGKLTLKSDGWAVIETVGVGYQVFLSSGTLAELPDWQGEVELWTHEHIRDDARDLYGFQTQQERHLFLRLLDVSGVGPKMALNILSLGKAEEIERKIDEGDVTWISCVPGVGKKTAQKIILELKGCLAGVTAGDSASEEVVSALMNLGYPRDQARAAASGISEGSVEGRLKTALKALAK